MDFRIGDRVMLKPNPPHRKETESNPLNTAGTVVEHKTWGLPIRVKWDNGTKNSYDPEDLYYDHKLGKLLAGIENAD